MIHKAPLPQSFPFWATNPRVHSGHRIAPFRQQALQVLEVSGLLQILLSLTWYQQDPFQEEPREPILGTYLHINHLQCSLHIAILNEKLF